MHYGVVNVNMATCTLAKKEVYIDGLRKAKFI